MQITRNSTGLAAGLSTWTDPAARRWCVVVIKGTFTLLPGGATVRAEEQIPLAYADEHYGAPDTTAIRYECDFAPAKPEADILLCGHVYAPEARGTRETHVRLELGSMRKTLRVWGPRRWRETGFGLVATDPEPFERLPLRYESAFGGSDDSHPDPRWRGAYLPNPIGTGFRKNPEAAAAAGTLLPNFEYPEHPLRSWGCTIPAAGFGVLGRSWLPRVSHAGTYDAAWRETWFPFLPRDFRESYFQSAAADQRLPRLRGGEVVRAWNLSPSGFLQFQVPEIEVPVTFTLDSEVVRHEAVLDTLLLEPDEQRVVLTWRTRLALTRKLTRLREVQVGQDRPRPYVVRFDGKRHYRGLHKLALDNVVGSTAREMGE